jgi:hypothetical protein
MGLVIKSRLVQPVGKPVWILRQFQLLQMHLQKKSSLFDHNGKCYGQDSQRCRSGHRLLRSSNATFYRALCSKHFGKGGIADFNTQDHILVKRDSPTNNVVEGGIGET